MAPHGHNRKTEKVELNKVLNYYVGQENNERQQSSKKSWTITTLSLPLRVCSFGVILIRIIDPRSLGSLCIKGTDESTLVTDSSLPLKHHASDHWSWSESHQRNAPSVLIKLTNKRYFVYFHFNQTNGVSNGLVPMLRVYNATARYVDQGGNKRPGAFAIYLEPWHSDIFDFLDLKKNTGKEEQVVLIERDLSCFSLPYTALMISIPNNISKAF